MQKPHPLHEDQSFLTLRFNLGQYIYMCVSGFSSEKKLGMVGRHYILFYRNILYGYCILLKHTYNFLALSKHVCVFLMRQTYDCQTVALGFLSSIYNFVFTSFIIFSVVVYGCCIVCPSISIKSRFVIN